MREVPRGEWAEFPDGFSRQHESWLVTVEVFGEEVGAQVEAGASGRSALTEFDDILRSAEITIAH